MSASKPRIVVLSERGQAQQACPCMGEVATPWPAAVEACRRWIASHLGTSVQGLHLLDSEGQVVGHVYYAWAEHALIPYEIEEGVAVVYCEWIQRSSQGQGYGRLLSTALIRQLQDRGCKGIIVAATDDEQCMHYGHFEKRGFQLLQQPGPLRLMYYPLRKGTVEVQPLQLRITPGRGRPVEVTVFSSTICPFEATTSLSAKGVALEYGRRVVLREIEASMENLRSYGASSGAYVNGQRAPGGASEEIIRQAIIEALEGI